LNRNSWSRAGRRALSSLGVLALALAFGCGRGEIKGTYEVELQILGAARPLHGTLILSTMPLDIPTLSEDDASIDSNWFGGDVLSANSCFILSTRPSRRGEATRDPSIVRVFEARIEPTGVRVPIEILNASDLRIVITKLQFFANALGGELEVETNEGLGVGRIHGARVEAASQQRCIEALAEFRTLLRSFSEGAEPS